MQKDRIFTDKAQREDFFKEVIYKDFLAIQERLVEAKKDLYDPVFEQKKDEGIKIRNIKNFLGV
jgi:hypothetical protein